MSYNTKAIDENATTVLLADNNPSYQDTVREYLEGQGFRVLLASDPTSARAIMARESAALYLLDIRLTDDKDENDASGVLLANQTDPSIPRILITAFTTPSVIRDVLKPSKDGAKPNIAIIDKTEGLEKLLLQIRLALAQLDPQFEEKLLRSFGSSAMIALRGKMDAIGSDESLRRLRVGLTDRAKELAKQQDDASRRVSQLHNVGLSASVLGMALIVATVIAVIFGGTQIALLSLVGSLITKAVHLLFSRREDKAHERLSEANKRLEKTNACSDSIEVASLIKDSTEREKALNLIVNNICTNMH